MSLLALWPLWFLLALSVVAMGIMAILRMPQGQPHFPPPEEDEEASKVSRIIRHRVH